MIPVPTNKNDIVDLAKELIEQCRVSVGPRSNYYRLMSILAETGRYDGQKSLLNLLYKILDRTSAHLFSPVELKFSIDFEKPVPAHFLDKAKVVAGHLTRNWELADTDTTFARGVFDSLKYGVAVLKQWPEVSGEPTKEKISYERKLVMPWNFGVYREDENDIGKQEALCETSILTMPEIWRRIWHLDDKKKLYDRIKTHARKGAVVSDPASMFHQVLSTSQLQTGVNSNTLPGGIVQIGNDPNYAVMGPVIGAETVEFHEIWVKDEDDYTTIQIVEPDILIAPIHKKANLLGVPKMQPYRKIQPNEVTNWFWGRSELIDLIEAQGFLSGLCDDIKRLFGLQIDKILAFSGDTTITDELYAQFRQAGYANLGQTGKVEDLTPKIPSEAIQYVEFLINQINEMAGFPKVMQGQGETGVRAGNHANLMQKMASPTLRDRALLVERQCAACADLDLTIKEAKDACKYWTKADEPVKDVSETSFLLSDLPDDWRVTVDSHSSSPIFSDENTQLVMAAHAKGVVQTEYVIDNVALPNKAEAKAQNRKHEAEQAKLFKEHPELLLESFKHGHGKR